MFCAVADELKRKRTRRNLSLGQLARIAGVAVGMIERLEAHKIGAARLSDLLAVAEALGVKLTVAVMPKARGKSQLLDLAKMRSWRGKRAIVRTFILLVCLCQITTPTALAAWLTQRNPELDGHSPADLLDKGQWKTVAGLIDDFLTGAPV